MYQKTLTLLSGEKLVIEWGSNWSNLSVYENGALIGSVAEKAELKAGRNFALRSGGEIMVLVSDYGLEVWQNGKELVSGTKSGSVDGFGSAFRMLISVGVMQIILSIIFPSGISVLVAGIGLGLIGLGIWARNSGSKTPFWIGIVLCVIDIPLSILQLKLVGVLITAILLYYLYRGTKSQPPEPTRKKDLRENAPLDTDL